MADRDMNQVVKERYGHAAAKVRAGEGCCAGGSDPITADLYDEADRSELPIEALQASLGCGNPTALAELHPGDVVLDLGSGGIIDVLLSARRMGPTGKAYGLDMTDEMLALAEENKARAGVTNAEFLRGEIEDIPLPDSAVDVIISNCVINLSVDKDRVFAEAFRVLRPRGRFAVSDMVLRGPLPTELSELVAAWTGCVAGALEETDYRAKLTAAGFMQVESSTFVRAVKPR
jgi:arsenite methyltransferase